MNTAMRDAFFKAKFPTGMADTPLGKALVKVAQTKAGVRHPGKGWSTNLSFRTFKALEAEGVL